jgi:hypothetical protein
MKIDGRYMGLIGVSACIRVIYRKCRGIHPNQDDIQNISVYLIAGPFCF